jgi:hypothetical protein
LRNPAESRASGKNGEHGDCSRTLKDSSIWRSLMNNPAEADPKTPDVHGDRQAERQADRADAALENVREGYGNSTSIEREIRPSDAGDASAAASAGRSGSADRADR